MQTPIMICVAAVTLGMALAGSAYAQGVLARTLMQTIEVPDSGYEAIIGTSGFGPNQTSGRQSHPGPEAGYVLEGSGTILVDGQPPIELKPGLSYKLAPGVVHQVRSGPKGVTVVVTWVVKKGEPLSTPAH